MFSISVYYKNGRVWYCDHVAQITNLGNDNIVIDTITDFNDHLSRSIKADEVESIKVRCM